MIPLHRSKPWLPVLAAVLPQPQLLGQKVGSVAPDITWERTHGFGDIANQRLSELRGSVLVLVSWTSFANTCAQQVPALNQLFANKAETGLVVIGVTGDAPELVLPWVEKHKVQFPTAISHSKDYRTTEVPEAIVIGTDFKLAWRGHPAALGAAGLDALLVGARPGIVLPGLEQVQARRRDGDFAGAWQRGQALLQAGNLRDHARAQLSGWLQEIEANAKHAAAAAAAAATAGDVHAQWVELDRIVKGYLGVPATDGAKERLEQLLADPKQKREIDAGKKLAEGKLQEGKQDYDAAFEIFKATASAFANTKAGKAAAAAMKALEQDGKLGFLASCPYCKAAGTACPTHRKKKKKT
jgi:peroxiredoxin